MPDPKTPEEQLKENAAAMVKALCNPATSDIDLAWAGFQAIASYFSIGGDFSGASFAWERFRRLVQK